MYKCIANKGSKIGEWNLAARKWNTHKASNKIIADYRNSLNEIVTSIIYFYFKNEGKIGKSNDKYCRVFSST